MDLVGGNDATTELVDDSAGIPPSEPAWYCVRTERRAEESVRGAFRRARLPVFNPWQRFEAARLSRGGSREEPVFPGYLFVRSSLRSLTRRLPRIQGSRGLVQIGRWYPAMPDLEITQLARALGTDRRNPRLLRPSQCPREGVEFSAVGEGLRPIIQFDLPTAVRLSLLLKRLRLHVTQGHASRLETSIVEMVERRRGRISRDVRAWFKQSAETESARATREQ